MESSNTLIYGLIDPRTWNIRYIGFTNKIKSRYSRHISESKRETNYKANWIKQLATANLLPLIVVLEEVPADDWEWYETWWIVYGKTQHWPLTNGTLGGEGMLGWTPSEETRQKNKNWHKGRKLSAIHKEHIGLALKGRELTDDHKNKLKIPKSKEHSNKIADSVRGENNGSSKLNKNQIIKIRELDMEGNSSYQIALLYHVSYSSIRNIICRRTWKHVE